MHLIQSISKCLTLKTNYNKSVLVMAKEFSTWQEAKGIIRILKRVQLLQRF